MCMFPGAPRHGAPERETHGDSAHGQLPSLHGACQQVAAEANRSLNTHVMTLIRKRVWPESTPSHGGTNVIHPDACVPDPFWAMAVKQRDHYCCVACGSKQHPRAHHITPRSAGGPNTLNNGQTLCAACSRRLQSAVPSARTYARPGRLPQTRPLRNTTLRLDPALLRTARVYLAADGLSVQEFLTRSLQRYVQKRAQPPESSHPSPQP
jgi:predicted HicB family RNase H-like nuclease